MRARTIVAAAIRLADGRTFTGPTHGQAYAAAEEAGVDVATLGPDDVTIGYVDDGGGWIAYGRPHRVGEAR